MPFYPAGTANNAKLKHFLGTLALLILVLLVFFHEGLKPGMVMFSNDGPLGAISTRAGTSQTLFGFWHDLNWIGYELPSASPNFTQALSLVLHNPALFINLYAPVALILFGLSTWLLLHQLRLSPVVCLLGAVAAALNGDAFSYACWGLPSLVMCLTSFYLAIAALLAPRIRSRWLRYVLAGFGVGMSLMEGYDNGAILSLFVAAFVIFQAFQEESGEPARKVINGGLRVALVALCAGWMGSQALNTLVGTQIHGVAQKKAEAKNASADWDFATQWSLPKTETLGIIIPGLFGYRMDTPEGGSYWGTIGQQPGWEQHHQGLPRFSGAGVYTGILVVLVGLCAVINACRGKGSPYTAKERAFVLFWTAVALIGLLFSWGRHAPFYRLFYSLPFFSTIRNPVKFVHVFNVAAIILFACGLEGLLRSKTAAGAAKINSLPSYLKIWWKNLAGFDRKWALGMAASGGLALLGWLIYASNKVQLQRYLETVGFAPEGPGVRDSSIAVATFSIHAATWFLVFWLVALAIVLVAGSGWFSGSRQKWFGGCVALFLIADFAHADTPWIIFSDYLKQHASNPVIDFLRKEPETRRVTYTLAPFGANALVSKEASYFASLCNLWLQHQFEYYNIQSLNIVQMPRVSELDKNFSDALVPHSDADVFLYTRMWELSNTRYVLGQKDFLGALNQQIDPVQHRFSIHSIIDVSTTRPDPQLEDLTADFKTNGNFALFEFSGALPRTMLFPKWETLTDDAAALHRITDPTFDPHQAVVVNASLPGPGLSTNVMPQKVVMTSYAPKKIELTADAGTATVLLLNQKYSPDWKVTVDGKPETLLRCNYIMQGVFLKEGSHKIELRFAPSLRFLYVSLSAIAVAMALLGFLAVSTRTRLGEPNT